MLWTKEAFERFCHDMGADYIYDDKVGVFAWRRAPGNTIEALEIEAAIPGFGQGVELYIRMIRKIQQQGLKPASVFGFQRKHNQQAKKFYKKMGWHTVDLDNFYGPSQPATFIVIQWKDLEKRLHCDV